MNRCWVVVLALFALLPATARADVAVETPSIAWDSGVGAWDGTRAVSLAGDFDGDGRTDIASFYDNGGTSTALWVFRATGSPGSVAIADHVKAWESGGWTLGNSMFTAGDFDHDGKDDIAGIYDYGNAQTKLWTWRSTSADGHMTFAAPVMTWDSGAGNWEWARTKLVSADFDGDGRDEIGALYRYNDNNTSLWTFRYTGPPGAVDTIASDKSWSSCGGCWDWTRTTAVAGDLDGDGRGDVAMYYDYDNSLTKIWVLRATGSPGAVQFAPVSAAWDSGAGRWEASRMKLVAGNLDTDGRLDFAALYNVDGAAFTDLHVQRSGLDQNGAIVVSEPARVWGSGAGNWEWGRSRPVAGDFDGDGRTDVGVFYAYDGSMTRLWVFRTREADRDGDGLVDSADRCPDQHRGAFDSDSDGCPDDGDHDGVLAGADCNDGDAGIRPGAVDTPGDGIDQDCSGADARYPRLAATVIVQVLAGRHSARVRKLRITDLDGGESIEVRCAGRGCPFKLRRRTAKRSGTLKLDALLKRHRLRVGARLEVRVTKAGAEGRVFVGRVRRRAFSTSRRCLPVGSTRSVRC